MWTACNSNFVVWRINGMRLYQVYCIISRYQNTKAVISTDVNPFQTALLIVTFAPFQFTNFLQRKKRSFYRGSNGRLVRVLKDIIYP